MRFPSSSSPITQPSPKAPTSTSRATSRNPSRWNSSMAGLPAAARLRGEYEVLLRAQTRAHLVGGSKPAHGDGVGSPLRRDDVLERRRPFRAFIDVARGIHHPVNAAARKVER